MVFFEHFLSSSSESIDPWNGSLRYYMHFIRKYNDKQQYLNKYLRR